MPAHSQAQANLARMALAHKAGHRLKNVSKEGMAKVRSMAHMSTKQLKDFAHVATKG
jgi:hypothetical protein